MEAVRLASSLLLCSGSPGAAWSLPAALTSSVDTAWLDELSLFCTVATTTCAVAAAPFLLAGTAVLSAAAVVSLVTVLLDLRAGIVLARDIAWLDVEGATDVLPVLPTALLPDLSTFLLSTKVILAMNMSEKVSKKIQKAHETG